MRIYKKERPDYDKDINLFTVNESLTNLFTIYSIEDPQIKTLFADLMCGITEIQIKGRGSKAHNDMADTIEEFWNTRKVLNISSNKKVIQVEKLIEEIYPKCINNSYQNCLISILRVPEYFYISHEELSEIQKNPLGYIKDVSMLSNDKSIFKIPGKELSLKEIIKTNQSYIEDHCDNFLEDMADKFEDYLNGNRFKSKSVKEYMLTIRRNLKEVLVKVKNDDLLLYSSKISSAFYPGSKSIIEDNFWNYDSKFFSEEWLRGYIRYPQIKMDGNYDYMRIGFGLGPDYKLRNIVLTNSNLQSLGGVIRFASKKTFKDFCKNNWICPIKTDDQSTDFKNMIDNGSYKNFKICFDLSKYSDYLLSQITDLIIDYLFKDEIEYASIMKKIFNMPINIKGNNFNITFGTGAGIKGNFDCITIANMLMVDFAAYIGNIDIGNIMIVGDDIYVDSDSEELASISFIVYTHFNCKINKKKSRAISHSGKVSFCNKHWWYEEGVGMESWNGIAPGLWMKQIYSLNRLNAIFSIMKSTNQKIDISVMDKLFLININNIQREFKINQMEVDLNSTYQQMKNIPYQLNGLADGMEGYDGTLQDWVEIVFNQFDTYVFMLANNSRIKDVFSRYYDIFPDHPILSELMISNGTYLSIIHEITESYDKVVKNPSYKNHINFAKAVKSGTTRFAKMDTDSKRISTKDRTSDFFNEDKFYRPKTYDVVSISDQRLSKLEIDVLKNVKENVPISEMWMMIKNKRGLTRSGLSPLWDSRDTIILYEEREGVRIRLYSLDPRQRNGIYEDWNYSDQNIHFTFDQFYPENNLSIDEKYSALRTLTDAIGEMKKSAMKSVLEILDLL